VSEAIKVAKTEAREARKELRGVKRAGGRISVELVERLNKTDRLIKDLSKIQKQDRQVKITEEQTRKTGRAIRAFVGAQALAQFAKGEILDPRALAAFAFAFQENIDSNAERIFGRGSRITKAIKAFSIAAPAIGEAVVSVVEAFSRRARERSTAKLIGLRFASGQISQEEFDIFQKKQGGFFGSGLLSVFEEFGGDTLGRTEKFAATFNALQKRDPKALKNALKGFAKTQREEIESEARLLGTKGPVLGGIAAGRLVEVLGQRFLIDRLLGKSKSINRLNAEVLRKTFQERFKKATENLGRELEEKDKEKLKFQILNTIASELPKDVIEDLTKAMSKAIQEDKAQEGQEGLLNSAAIKFKAAQAFKARDEERLARIRFVVARSRVALTGPIRD